jgi:hypothetical protein
MAVAPEAVDEVIDALAGRAPVAVVIGTVREGGAGLISVI